MFVLKSKHQAVLANLESEFQAYKDLHTAQVYHSESRIADLKNQIQDLRSLVFVKVDKEAPRDAREADAVLSASEKSPDMSEEEMTKLIAGERELDLIMSGNYDTDLLQ